MPLRLIVNLVLVALVGCTAPGAETVTIRGVATAGPVCPVESVPPDPACAPRPVGGAEIVVKNEAGESIARVRTTDDGSFAVSLVPGTYQLVPQPVEGLMGTAAAVVVVLVDGVEPDRVDLSYDTGIR